MVSKNRVEMILLKQDKSLLELVFNFRRQANIPFVEISGEPDGGAGRQNF